MQIRTLEDELGVLLFERRGPRISLSPIGKRLYRLAMPLVDRMDRLPDTFAEVHFGVVQDKLRIGAGQTSAAYLLPTYLKRFRERWPDTRFEVQTGTGQQRMGWLRDHEIDLVVGAMDVVPDDLDFHWIRDSDLVLITPEDHPLAGRNSVSLEEASAYPFVGHTSTNCIRQFSEAVLRMHRVSVDVVVEVDGWGVITNYVTAGVGISFVPDLCLRAHDRLWKIPLNGASPPQRYGAVTRRGGPLALTASRLLETMMDDWPGASTEP